MFVCCAQECLTIVLSVKIGNLAVGASLIFGLKKGSAWFAVNGWLTVWFAKRGSKNASSANMDTSSTTEGLVNLVFLTVGNVVTIRLVPVARLVTSGTKHLAVPAVPPFNTVCRVPLLPTAPNAFTPPYFYPTTLANLAHNSSKGVKSALTTTPANPVLRARNWWTTNARIRRVQCSQWWLGWWRVWVWWWA